MSFNTEKKEEISLLSTKLIMPRPRQNYIVRNALFEKLKHCSQMSVIFVKGAAGMGKTTLLSSFIVETKLKNTAWLSLDESNNSLFSFWRYFRAAAGKLVADLETDASADLFFELHEQKKSLIFLINALCSNQDYYIVLDDFHCITDPALIESLEFFLQSMPDNLHLFLLSREDPPVYLGAMAVSGKLLYLSDENMKLTQTESLAFLKDTMKLKTDDEELMKISKFAEGWVGGLQLAAAGGVLSGDLMHQTGKFAADYLNREVFCKLTAEEQDFLIRTGFLPWFDASICAAIFTSLDFSAMLENLLNKNLFLICIDEKHGIYRYHNLLSEYLKQRLAEKTEQEQKDLMCRAAAAFEAHHSYNEAVPLLIAVKDYNNAMKCIEQMGSEIFTGEYLRKIPEEYLAKNIDLATRELIYYVDCGNFHAFMHLCNVMLTVWKDTPLYPYLHFARDIFDTHKSTTVLPPAAPLKQIENYYLQPETIALILLGCSSLMIMNREYAKADSYADQAMQLTGRNSSIYYYSMGCKAQLAEETGRLNDALQIYAQAETRMSAEKVSFMRKYNFRIGIIGIYLKRMELPQAKKYLERAQSMVSANFLPKNLISYSFDYNLAEYDMLSGSENLGEEMIWQVIGSSDTQNWADRLLIELAAANRISPNRQAMILSEYNSFLSNSSEPSPVFELLCARLYYQQNDIEKANSIAQKVLSFSRKNQNRLHLIEADLLLLRMNTGTSAAERRQRNNLLREAVYYAYENHILQPFYIERSVLEPLWTDFYITMKDQLSAEEQVFIKDIQRVCCASAQTKQTILSAREMDVLNELAKGNTNPQIAEQLCISLSTVKTHVLSIYGKLEVSSRLNAVEKAKQLRLIP